MSNSTATVETAAGPIALLNGGEAGAPLLWVHGYTLDSSLWLPIWSCLPEFTHVGMDLPGHGSSRPFRDGDTLAHCAEALIEVADAIGAEDVVGMSFGATVALLAAAAAPRRLRTLALAAPALPGGLEDQDAADCNQALTRLHRDRGVGSWLPARWLAEPSPIFSHARRQSSLFGRIEEVAHAHRWDELSIPSFVPRRDPRLMGQIGRISADVLLVLGGEDIPSFGRTAELLRRTLSQATVQWVDGAGHLALLEKPAEAALLLSRHLQR